jgi:hypothetical protein
MVGCSLHRLLPVLCSFVAFILVMLALFAGHRPGALEEYDIISVSHPMTHDQSVQPETPIP